MAIVSASTVVNVSDAGPVMVTHDITLLPASSGTLALRKLTYPDDTFAPLIYCKNPDKWTNFDTAPMVKRPSIAALRTLEANKLVGWQGFERDALVTETWRGSDQEASLPLDCLRQLYQYYENPPINGFIHWHPRDRTNKVYQIVISSLTVDGAEISFDFIAAHHDLMVGDVTFSFYILGEVL